MRRNKEKNILKLTYKQLDGKIVQEHRNSISYEKTENAYMVKSLIILDRFEIV